MGKTIVIILGAARSGSTLLAKAIGGHSKCFALGEINRFNDEIISKETHCGCGNKLIECDFWNDIIANINSDKNEDIRKSSQIFNVGIFKQITKKNRFHFLIPTILFKKKYKFGIVDKEINNTYGIYNKVFLKTNTDVLIDSTKGLFRALILASRKTPGYSFKFIQITRDGRGVLNSGLKDSYSIMHKNGIKREYKGEHTRKPNVIINQWLYVNLRNYLILKLFRKSNTYFLRYEDFTSNPSKYLREIYELVGLDFEEKALFLDENENHILGGNASRINARRIKKQDEAWRKNLDKSLLKVFSKKAGWFNKFLGYN
ncbi:MAG: sulfotransferase [Melioribacteraceae bacterium]|nr:sulfotransferase [Melioribacteraceae bacterium]